ncbi:HAMP domain-containing sensor histidine kinase [Arenibacter sp. GZD96]|uniref:sensor histidine kinase n=1 Tax=Aurantibrevibacter litoralis TaxID=3106030 RepID=UPI002AFE1154|nr:HAMP domain-containing sensor histidine kinase [Arenibacter sp. GZD-96]MEA1787551.1 HAMP domain-containing sensor histidine kinase [Arenibacter sp. GZD-96]
MTTEEKLNERIKELTCLYQVTTIIGNCDYDQIETSLKAIVYSLEKAWLYVEDTYVTLVCGDFKITTNSKGIPLVALKYPISVFNKNHGYIEVGYPDSKYFFSEFLDEEKKLLESVCMDVGNLLEKKQIRDNEMVMRRQMERKDRLNILGEISAGIAHELNTPLANILGFAELLKTSIKDTKAQKDVDKIVDSAIFCREVVKKLMFFTCEMPQHMGAVDLRAVVENVFTLLDPTLKKNKVTYTLSFNKELIELKADTVQLTQVFFNLVMNAIYYSPENSSIDILVTDRTQSITIEIADQGTGIDQKNADKIFEPFFTTKPIGEGTGLGLSVVHGIINSHKGSIMHKPNTPKGTIFIIQLPKL